VIYILIRGGAAAFHAFFMLGGYHELPEFPERIIHIA